MECESKDNITIVCSKCSDKFYPNKGHWTKTDMKYATLVKKNFNGEHMWIKIISVQNDGILGEVDNIPIFPDSPKLGQTVYVEYKEMEDIQ
jgi:uncharacterized protein YegJ (DUF2314 family)